jgi:hypothetical protein
MTLKQTHITLLSKDIHLIAKDFPLAAIQPLYPLPEFKEKNHQYDRLIAGWTHHWNATFTPIDPLDPNLIKALIASESSFNANIIVGEAHGLMQLMTKTLHYLADPNELKNHFIQIKTSDLLDPNINICAGIRWLFRKKQIAVSKQRFGWREAVREFKGYKTTDPIQKGMHRFDALYQEIALYQKI